MNLTREQIVDMEAGREMRKSWNRTEIDDSMLIDKYVNKKMTVNAISKEINVSPSPIYRRLRELKLIRTNSESHLGKRPSNYKGGHIDSGGYRVVPISRDSPFSSMGIKVSGTNALCIREHRLVMATHLNRPLNQGEVVHHKNGVKTDNRVDNLELLTGQGEHMAYTFTQNHINKLMSILNGCPHCKAALLTTL